MRAKSLETAEKVSAVIVAVGVIISAVMFFGSVNDKGNANAERLDRQKDKIQRMEAEGDADRIEIRKALTEILQRVTRIEQYQKDHE